MGLFVGYPNRNKTLEKHSSCFHMWGFPALTQVGRWASPLLYSLGLIHTSSPLTWKDPYCLAWRTFSCCSLKGSRWAQGWKWQCLSRIQKWGCAFSPSMLNMVMFIHMKLSYRFILQVSIQSLFQPYLKILEIFRLLHAQECGIFCIRSRSVPELQLCPSSPQQEFSSFFILH